MKTLVLALLLVGGCGGTGAGGGGSGGGSGIGGNGTGGSGTVTLTVGAVDAPPSIGGVAPSSGRSYVTTAITLSNVSAAAPVPASPIYFTLTTSAGLVLTAAPQSSALMPPCPLDTSLSAGARLSCKLAFEVPTSDGPASLGYDDHHGDSAAAAVARPTLDDCEQLAVWSTSSCTNCLIAAHYATGACGAETMAATQCWPQSATSCVQTCQSMNSGDVAAMCACKSGCAPACTAQTNALDACLVKACTSACK